MADSTCILTIIKKFTYRDKADEEWSNKYMFDGSTPSGDTAWQDLCDEVVEYERAILPSTSTIVRAYGHDSIDPHAVHVWAHTYVSPPAGTLVTTGGKQQMGDVASYVSWATGQTNSKGKPIYLRKYYHDAWAHGADRDVPLGDLTTALEAIGAALVDGLPISGRKLVMPDGHVAIGSTAGTFLTTRTLKRRGRRSRPSP